MTSTVSSMEKILSSLSEEKAKLLNLILEGKTRHMQAIRRLPRITGELSVRCPMSWAQQRLWFIDQLEGGSTVYNIPFAVRLRGALDERAMRAALDTIVKRHEALRTVFRDEAGSPLQEVRAVGSFPLQSVDLTTLSADSLRKSVECVRAEEASRPFDLSSGPLIRGRLLRLTQQEYLLLITMHHIVADGWSVGIFIQELGELYRLFVAGSADPLEPLPIQYADYAQWQRDWLQGTELEKQLNYWRDRLKDAPAELELPSDRPRPTKQSFSGANVPVVVDARLSRALKSFASRYEVTLFMLLHTVWAVLMARLSGQHDILIGTPVANRQRAELERLIGFFVNTIVLRIEVQPDATVEELLRQVKEVTTGAYDHQDVPFERLVEAVQPQRSLARNPLFQVAFALQSMPKEALQLGGITAHWEDIGNEPAMFDVLLSLEDCGEKIAGSINYATDLFDEQTIARWAESFGVLLEAFVTNPRLRVGRLPILPANEKSRLLQQSQMLLPSPASDELVHELFEAQAARTPDAIAVTFADASLTYAALSERTNQLARYLCRLGVGPDHLVGICLPRGIDLVVALIGCLKAGGAYVPLDPNYPEARLAHMLADSAPQVVITHDALRSVLPLSVPRVVRLDAEWPQIAMEAAETLAQDACHNRSKRLAYVIYTSGSTGQPKGVMVEHRNVTRLFSATAHWFHFDERDVWTMFHSFAFDFSVWELWGALLYGGRVVIVPYITACSPQEFYHLVCEQGVTVLNQTPSAFSRLIDAQSQEADLAHSLRVVIFGGEALDLGALRPWVARNALTKTQLINMYGITETTVHVTRRQLTAEEIGEGRGSSVGQPIPDLRVYVLDADREPVPVGVTGELYVGGAGVARGYLNRPELTLERFVVDPFTAQAGARLYKTGDIGRWRSDGTLDYLGRNDQQVKIRGFRIELGEIEAQLMSDGSVKTAVVVARLGLSGEKVLVAYIVPNEANAAAPQLAAHLRARLKQGLPDYMIPAAFVSIDRLPLTANGKLDRTALPAPDVTLQSSRAYEMPQNAIEVQLAEIWSSLLGVPRVGRQDNFFELGGHSLLIVQLMDWLRRTGLRGEIRHVFERPTLAELARTLVTQAPPLVDVPPNLIPAGCASITPDMLPLVSLTPEQIQQIADTVPGGCSNIQDIYPLVPLQEGILFHHLLHQGGDTYVLLMLMSLSSRQALDQLVSALQHLVDRHDILRTAVLWEQLPRPVQVVYRQAVVPVAEIPLLDDRPAIDQLRERMSPERQRLDLRVAPLMRLEITHDSASNQWFALLQLHHLVCDNKSMDTMLAEVTASMQGSEHELSPAVPYRNHVAHTLSLAANEASLAYFKQKLADVVEPTAPFGILDVHGDGRGLRQALAPLDRTLAERLRSQARRLGVTPATLFHAAWALVVARTTGRQDVVFGSVLLGRMHGEAGAQHVLGMFINTLPLRLKLHGVSATELIERTRGELTALMAHEQASLAMAQRCSGISGTAPLFSTVVNYRHAMEQGLGFGKSGDVRLLATQSLTNYPIMLSVDDLGEGFEISVDADARLDPDRIAGYALGSLTSLVTALEAEPRSIALSLPVIPECEKKRLLHEFNPTSTAYPHTKLIHELFEEQVALTPQAIAVVYERESLTYAQLNGRANQLARGLLNLGTGSGRLVGICAPRSIEMVIGLLATLKAGAAYVPLDPNYPSDRLRYMLDDARPQVVLVQAATQSKVTAPGIVAIDLNATLEEVASLQCENLPSEELGLDPSSRVYVIYTSGSTGRPKGIEMPHGPMVNLIEWHRKTFGQAEGKRVLQFAALSFDVAFQETFSTLCTGGTLVLLDEWIRRDPAALTRLLIEHSIDRVFLPPLMLQSLAEHCHSSGIPSTVRDVIAAGEQLRVSPEMVSFFNRLGARLHNHYGPTETHVVTALTLSGDAAEWPTLPTIGQPISNCRIYILDGHRQPVPMGVPGELYIGGTGVALGYRERPELTAERFLEDPFSTEPNARMYRTGDLGLWREDGTIEYLGRNDSQVKIRGYRIELGEIEAQLSRHPRVRDAAVIVREDTPGDKRLVAYVTAREEPAPTADELRELVKVSLPEHMVPSAVVLLERLPLSPNGKLDRRALPMPDLSAYANREFVPLEGNTEILLGEIWQQVLKVKRVGRDDDFFELGGHSLLSMRLIAKVAERFCVRLPVFAAFQSPTVRKMAAAVNSMREPQYELGDLDGLECEEGIL